MKIWRSREYDQLLQEAIKCDKSLRSMHMHSQDDNHVTRVFTRLMLCGKIRAAIRWLSENGQGYVLQPSDMIDVKNASGELLKQSVLEVLLWKHPEPWIPPLSHP